jgi:transcriptional regulator with XRE-family HTH domain
MTRQVNEAEVTAIVVARIHEFRTTRGLSVEQLAKAAKLSASEKLVIQGEADVMTVDLLRRIARALKVHPAILLMASDDPHAQLLEYLRELPRAQLQRLSGELISRGIRRTEVAG